MVWRRFGLLMVRSRELCVAADSEDVIAVLQVLSLVLKTQVLKAVQMKRRQKWRR